jgi:hypothetical protein
MPPSPIVVFEENVADAERLLDLATALANTRVRRMRWELREAIGAALSIPKRRWDDLDCAESDDVFVVMKPDGGVPRERFSDAELKPLLRQAVVAISAAVETYVADKACEFIADALIDRPAMLRQVSVNLTEVLELDGQYRRRGWGYRKILQAHLRDIASPAPSQIGIVFSTVGRKVEWGKLDSVRKVAKGQTENDLDVLYRRRNDIAHQADRRGSGKGAIEIGDVRAHLANARSIIEGGTPRWPHSHRSAVIPSRLLACRARRASCRAAPDGPPQRGARGSAQEVGPGSLHGRLRRS